MGENHPTSVRHEISDGLEKRLGEGIKDIDHRMISR